MNFDTVDTPEKLRQLPEKELPQLAESLRREIIETVGRNGGHLASSLGAVDLIVALHKVFDARREPFFFDVGHQAYAHKMLTGRRGNFSSLRKTDGLSGFPFPAESAYDPAVSGHAGCALSAALGYAAADPDATGKVIAVVGDGASGCGVTFEAMNCAAECAGSSRLLLILNDNQMSISRNVGALTRHFNTLLSGTHYNRFRSAFKKMIEPAPRLTRFFRHLNDVLKSALLPRGMFFESLGFRYLGPVNGHDLPRLLKVLNRIKSLEGPIVLHVITTKGRGCVFAEKEPTRYHGVSGFDSSTGALPEKKGGFSDAFTQAMLQAAEKDPHLVAVSPAMLNGTGLVPFAKKFQERCFDVGIAEEHALTFAAGLARGGAHPVCAFYDTFLQRALDAVYHDVALAKLPVVIAVDRAGAVEDGPTHHGIYNCGFLRTLPGIAILSPAAESEIAPALDFLLALRTPALMRYPRGGAAQSSGKPFVLGKAVVVRHGGAGMPVLWSIGAELGTALATADQLAARGMTCTVIDARFLKPFDTELARSFASSLQCTIEDHCVSGGLASALEESLRPLPHGKILAFGWSDDHPVGHGSVAELRKRAGLTPEAIAAAILQNQA